MPKTPQEKYRHNHCSSIVLQYSKEQAELIRAYSKSIGLPTATWIKGVIMANLPDEFKLKKPSE